jgi:UDP-N-acetyl-D-mannosaminuronic acid dehydrogenase
MFNKTISIIGGVGHVGLPLGLAFADKNYKVQLIDINLETIKNVNNGMIPYKEDGAPRIL